MSGWSILAARGRLQKGIIQTYVTLGKTSIWDIQNDSDRNILRGSQIWLNENNLVFSSILAFQQGKLSTLPMTHRPIPQTPLSSFQSSNRDYLIPYVLFPILIQDPDTF